jgi:hypothetical protein
LGVVYDRATVPAVIEGGASGLISESPNAQSQKRLTLSYLRAAHRYDGILDRLNRYEVSLWRQVAQIIFVLRL